MLRRQRPRAGIGREALEQAVRRLADLQVTKVGNPMGSGTVSGTIQMERQLGVSRSDEQLRQGITPCKVQHVNAHCLTAPCLKVGGLGQVPQQVGKRAVRRPRVVHVVARQRQRLHNSQHLQAGSRK